MVFPHAIAIDNIKIASFAAYHQQMRVRPGLIWQQQWASRSNIEVVRVQFFLVERSEEVADLESAFSRRQFEDAVAVIAAACIGVEFAVSGGQKDVAIFVSGGTCIALPDSALFVIR